MKKFIVGGTTYTVCACTAIALNAGDTEAQDALFVTNYDANGEKTESVVFGYDMPETLEDFYDMANDFGAWDSDWDTCRTVKITPASERKMIMEIINAYETGRYDPRTCCNGGGYWNFKGSCRAGELTITVEDESCGDFGSRIFFSVSDGERTANIIYCTMESDCISEQCDKYGWCGQDELDAIQDANWVTVDVLWDAHHIISEAAWDKKAEEEWEEEDR